MGSSHVVFLNIFFYGDVTQKRHWQKNLPVGFNGLRKQGAYIDQLLRRRAIKPTLDVCYILANTGHLSIMSMVV